MSDADGKPRLSGMDKIFAGPVLDRRIKVYFGGRSFEGTIGETDHPDILVLHTGDNSLMDIRIDSIDAVEWLRD